MSDSAASAKPKRQMLPPHKFPADADAYMASCTEDERKLIKLAVERLGSSYFMEKSLGYLAWKAKQASSKK